MRRSEKQLELFGEHQKENWSYSRLKSLRRCALEYKVRYVDGGKWTFQPGYIDVQAGRLLHHIIRDYYSSNAYHTSQEPYALLIELYKKLAPTTSSWKEDLQGEKRTYEVLRLFAYSKLSRFQAIATEVSCKAKIGKVVFSGKTDLIYRTEEHPDSFGILEFKLNDVEVRTQNKTEMFLQCLIYHMGLPDIYLREVGWGGVYIFDTGEFLESKIEDSMVEEAVLIIERALQRAEGPDFPPTRNPFCSSCGYQSKCPTYSRF